MRFGRFVGQGWQGKLALGLIILGIAPMACTLKSPSAQSTMGSNGSFALIHQNLTSNCNSCHDVGKAFVPPNYAAIQGTVTNEMVHTAANVPADCAVCHYSGAVNNGFSSWVVESIPNGTITPLTTLGVTHSNFTPQACTLCHGSLSPLAATTDYKGNAVPAHNTSPYNGDCAGCHTAPGLDWTVASVTAHTSSQTNCASCHNSSGADPTKYNAISNVLTSQMIHTFAGLPDCYTCHRANAISNSFTSWTLPEASTISNSSITTLSALGTFHTNFTPTTCTTCHSGLAPQAATTDVNGNAVPAHNASPYNGDCAGCHISGIGLDWSKGQSTGHTSTQTNCASCHNASGVDPAKYNAVSGVLTSQMMHTFAGLPDCYTCHRATAISNNFTSWILPEASTITNTSMTTLASLGTFHTNFTPSSCATCHSGLAPQSATTDAKGNAVPAHNVAPYSADCVNCHTSGMGLDWTNVTITQHVSTTTNCATCHDVNMSVPPPNFSITKTTITNQMLHSYTDPNQSFPDCSKCHVASAVASNFTSWVITEPFAVTNTTYTVANPGSFHANFGGTPATCVSCHTNAAQAPQAATTDANGNAVPAHNVPPYTTGDCAGCHITGAGTDWTKGQNTGHSPPYTAGCTSCHGPNGSYKNDLPATTAWYTYGSRTNSTSISSVSGHKIVVLYSPFTTVTNTTLTSGGGGNSTTGSGCNVTQGNTTLTCTSSIVTTSNVSVTSISGNSFVVSYPSQSTVTNTTVNAHASGNVNITLTGCNVTLGSTTITCTSTTGLTTAMNVSVRGTSFLVASYNDASGFSSGQSIQGGGESFFVPNFNANASNRNLLDGTAPGGYNHDFANANYPVSNQDCVTCHTQTATAVANVGVTWVGTGYIDHSTFPNSNQNCSPCHGSGFETNHEGMSLTTVPSSQSCAASNCHNHKAPVPSGSAPDYGGTLSGC